jgi:Ser/Thr protein kinase RdoA (MazF antagonist)
MVDPGAPKKKSASKKRLRWEHVPAGAQAGIERLAGGQVVAAENCTGGFSPGMASRLELAGGRRVFVKAMDAAEWPDQAVWFRTEALVSASLPDAVPAPRLMAWSDDGRWVVLVFEHVDGVEPNLRRYPRDGFLVAAALDDLATLLTPAPIALPGDHPRLGGWADLAADQDRLARLPGTSRWAADHLGMLIELEQAGLAAAKGDTLVHFDAYPHNILLASGRVVFVDWPHARPGAPVIDLIAFASSAAAAGMDPEQLLVRRMLTAGMDPHAIDGILAAHAGFCVEGSLYDAEPAFAPIIAAKAELGAAATAWLRRRLAGRGI